MRTLEGSEILFAYTPSILITGLFVKKTRNNTNVNLIASSSLCIMFTSAEGPRPYTEVLSSMPSTGWDYNQKLMFLQYESDRREYGKTFFVRTRDVRDLFRHGGNLSAIPPLVHVTARWSQDNIVLVYNEHSGVGKTVELCCSAYIRGADLAIYHRSTWEDEIQANEITSTSGVDSCDARKMLAEKIVKRIVGEAVE